MLRVERLRWAWTIDDPDLEMQQAPVHLCELLTDLAAESLDLLVERAKALGNCLDI